MDIRPRNLQADPTVTAESKIDTILKGIATEAWPTGAQVTATIVADRFYLSKDEGARALTLLEHRGVVENQGGKYYVK